MPLVPNRKPNPKQRELLRLQSSAEPASPTQVGAVQIRRIFNLARDSAVITLERVHRVLKTVGEENVKVELGASDTAELIQAYRTLRTFILTVDPTADVPTLRE